MLALVIVARLIILSVSLKAIHASVAFCFQMVGPTNLIGRQVVGFQVWTEKGETAAQYRSVYLANKTKLKSNGWEISANFNTKYAFTLNSVSIHSPASEDFNDFPIRNICPAKTTGGRVYYGCLESSHADMNNTRGEFCEDNFKEFTNFCMFNYTMGTDVVRC